jgi:hypothetical protein
MAFSLLCFAVCRWQLRLGFLFGFFAVVWAGLFPFYWHDWFSTARAASEYGDWRIYLGLVAAISPLLFVLAGCLRGGKRVA